ncbi:MAG: translation initiation factor [Planctomycetota bacterium]|nr:translation initiation factor [Planctomycetota bacterium]
MKPEKTAATTDQPPASTTNQVVVRREKKGRGGKTVTRVSGLELNAKDLTSLARDLKQGLGCGASVDGEDILLQGALTDRAAAWLMKHRGVRVTIGN